MWWSVVFVILLVTITNSQAKPIVMKERSISGTTWNYWTNKAWGVNLGNWLILEKWMGGHAFDGSNAQDEWTLSASNTNTAATILKDHWDTWVTEDDFRKLADAKVNHIRIPVGYWAFITPDSGEPYIHQGQKAQIERILGYCATHGNMYALIDLHGLPGSQNGEAHSGHNSGRTDFFTKYNIDRSLRTVQAVVDWTNQLDERLKQRIAGIEVANEPKPNGDAQEVMLKDYYRRAYTIVSASRFKIPMVFHDAFRGPSYWRGFFPSTANAVLDLHPYWAFPPSNDKNTILEQICDKKKLQASFDLPVLYGEWSLASGVPRTDDWMRQFLDTQVSVYQSSTNAAGAVFWSLKNTIDSDAWSFEQLMDENIINANTFQYHPMAKC